MTTTITLTKEDFEAVLRILKALNKKVAPVRVPTVDSCPHCNDMGEGFEYNWTLPDTGLVCAWGDCGKEIPSEVFQIEQALTILAKHEGGGDV